MKDLLRADFYRLFRSKFFYILLAVMAAVALLSGGMIWVIYAFAGSDVFGVSVSAEGLQRLSFDGTLGYCSAIAASIFICGDYGGGGIRNKVLTGCGRKKIYLSALLVCVFVSVCMYLLSQLIVLAFGGIAFGLSGVSAYDYASRFAAGLLLAASFGAVFSSIAMLCAKMSTALIVSIVLLFTLTILMSLLGVAQLYFDSAAFDRFVRVFGWLTPSGQTTCLAGQTGDYWVMFGFSCAWILAAVFLFSLPFAKKDIK